MDVLAVGSIEVAMVLSLILEEIDEDTKCISKSSGFKVQDIDELKGLLEIDFADDRDVEYQYDLTEAEVVAVACHYNLDGFSGVRAGRLRSRAQYDDLPYEIHTGRELSMMLSGVKPMAYFVHIDGNEIRDPVEEAFEPHVKSQIIVRHEYNLMLGEKVRRKATYIIFTLPGEEWRANALMLLKASSLKAGWSEGMERMEGALLGYEDWQNDLHIEYCRNQKLGWTRVQER